MLRGGSLINDVATFSGKGGHRQSSGVLGLR